MVYKTPKEVQERKDEKRKSILTAAARVFAANGYHNTSVKNIVDESGISVGSFYFYFKNKEDIFATLYDEMYSFLISTVHKILPPDDKDIGKSNIAMRLTTAITTFLRTFQRNENLARIMMIEAVGLNPRFEKKRADLTNMFSNHMTEYLSELKRLSLVDVPDPKTAALAYIGTIYNTVSNWLQGDTQTEIDSYIFPLVTYNLKGLGIEFKENEVKAYIKNALDTANCFEQEVLYV